MTKDEVEKDVCDLAMQVQERMDSLFVKDPVPHPGSALHQAGLRDGYQTVVDYLNHDETGLAFDHLVYMITEADVPMPAEAIGKLKSVAQHLKVPDPADRVRVASR